MAADSSVIDAISAAVAANPGNTQLRLHLAALLLESSRAAEALQHCQAVLDTEPDSLAALPLAARAAEALGDAQKAAGFKRLASALTESEAPAAPSNVVPLRVVEGGLSEEGAWTAETTTLKLADVAGMEQVKRRLNLAFLAPLRNPEMMKMYGKTLRGGLMLYGPPGCGKTFIARATAGEMGARFVSVGLADVLDMYLGQSERNLHEIFETARRNAPCVLFFDEIDALGRKRSQMRNSAGREAVNQLLAELDSVGNDNRGVFVLAATNHPWDVDTALRRPGRLDRTLLVLPPDAPAREAVLRYHVSAKPVEELDLAWLAAKTEGYSGADLAHLCESAAELAMEESMASGTPRPLRQTDFKKALKDVKPSTRPWFETARNYAMFANEGGTYDELLDYLRAARMV
jgi:SpoVK/Ycf46/Vps4 family AAA+-type ATPase